MLIIVEGADGAGKTTLCQELASITGARLLHRGPPERDPVVEYTEDLQGYRPRGDSEELMGLSTTDRHVVCDRWHWGEMVYGPILRGESKLSWDGFRQVDDLLLQRGAVVVWMWESNAELARRLSERGDDLVQPDQLGAIQAGYSQVAWQSRVPVMRMTTDKMKSMRYRVVGLARTMENAAWEMYWRGQ